MQLDKRFKKFSHGGPSVPGIGLQYIFKWGSAGLNIHLVVLHMSLQGTMAMVVVVEQTNRKSALTTCSSTQPRSFFFLKLLSTMNQCLVLLTIRFRLDSDSFHCKSIMIQSKTIQSDISCL